MKKFYDTCSLLELTNSSDINATDICLSSVTLQELENIKTSANKDSETKYRARVAVRALKDIPDVEIIVVNKDDYNCLDDKGLEITNDNLIIASAYRYSQGHDIIFYTEDLLCGFIAKNYFGLEVQSVKTDDKSDMYKGYKVVHGNTDTINKYMESINLNDWSVNEYLIIENTDDDISKEMRFDGEKFVNLKLPPSKFIKGKNSLQRCALDILMNPEITVAAVLGGYGSGKTFLAMQMALYNVQEKGNQSKILGVRETLGEGQSIGYLPGTKDEKVGNFFAPLAQSLNGGEFELEKLKMSGILEVNVPYYMKGTTYNNTVIICDEAEDLSESQIRLIGTRLGENSKIYFAGDYKQSIVNKSQNNPLVKMCNEFKGKHNFACIYLGEDVRSETSKMFAELFEI
nr:MAG TPA: NYN ribonuclease and ATPase [Caudoviricetes sp.]